jgi:hypothetical protein
MSGTTPVPADVEGVDWVYISILGWIRRQCNRGRKSPEEFFKWRKKVVKVRENYGGGWC